MEDRVAVLEQRVRDLESRLSTMASEHWRLSSMVEGIGEEIKGNKDKYIGAVEATRDNVRRIERLEGYLLDKAFKM